MTLPSYSTARDEILGLFNTDWIAKTPAATGGEVPPVHWHGLDAGTPPPTGKPWVRVVVRHGPSRQATFGAVGSRRFERAGLVTVQVLAPLSAGNGLSLAGELAIIARDAFEGRGTTSGIWFRNARVVEVGRDGDWFQYNVVVEFQYDEMR